MAKKKNDSVLGEVPTEIVTQEEFPEIKTVGIIRVKGGWSTVKLTTKEDKVLSAEMSDPEPRAICVETFKIWFAKEFLRNEV
jgi:hypothetical protein